MKNTIFQRYLTERKLENDLSHKEVRNGLFYDTLGRVARAVNKVYRLIKKNNETVTLFTHLTYAITYLKIIK